MTDHRERERASRTAQPAAVATAKDAVKMHTESVLWLGCRRGWLGCVSGREWALTQLLGKGTVRASQPAVLPYSVNDSFGSRDRFYLERMHQHGMLPSSDI